MKLKKSAGPDDLMAEHLKYGKQSIIMWLTGILNTIVDVEQVLACFKTRCYHPHLLTKVEERILLI